MKKNKWILIWAISMIIALFLLTFIVIQIIKENTTCSKDPFIYAAKKLKQAGGNYRCYCNSLNKSLLDFSFNEDGIEILAPQNIKTIELSNISWKK